MKSTFATMPLLLAAVICVCSCAGDGDGLTESGDPVGGAESVTISPSKDNTLYEDAGGAVSNGVGAHFFAGAVGVPQQGALRRGVIAFDVAAALPAGVTLTSATLTLHLSREASSSGPGTVELRRCLADWGEGTSDAPLNEGGGAPSTNGDATWIHTMFSSSTWTAPGGDFSSTVSAAQTVDAVGFYSWSGTQVLADVQAWLDSPGDNFGWVVIGNEATIGGAKRYDTRENSDAAFRPQLTVEYTPNP